MKLGPPASGEVVIFVDPRRTGSAFAMGTHTLLPRAEIPLQRHLVRDLVWFVHKGQGRAAVGEQVKTVVPGAMLHVPKQAWHSLRNTGTGLLQVTWIAAPPGLEDFFRELAQQGPSVDAAARDEIAKRHGVEFGAPRAPREQPVGAPRRHRRGHRPRGRRPARALEHAPVKAGGPVPRPPSPETSRPSPALTPPSTPRPTASHPAMGGAGRGPSRPVKEVYMSGRWVPVVGEGPMIAPGPEHKRRHRRRR